MSSMLNLPGELLKSGVNNVVSGGRRLVGAAAEGVSVRDKTTLQVKGTPSKDAITATNYSIKSGYLMKRNEQGQFHRRYVCTVPHLFLYYFDNEMADSPHGIIDLELFRKIEIEDDNETIKLSAADDLGLRSYYLQLKDPGELNDWVASLLRDRFHIIKEERDAYRALQDQFTGEMEVTTQQAKNSSADMERLMRDVMEARRDTEEAHRHIATALSIIGISEDEMRGLSSTAQYGAALSRNLKDFMQAADNKTAADKEEFEREMAVQDERIARLEDQCEAEQEARKGAEVRCSLEGQEAEQRVREAVNQMDQTALNMQMAVAAKVAAEGKAAQLSEQKKLLVKEVKQQRKRIEELVEALNVMRTQQQQTLQQLQQAHQYQQGGGNGGSHANSRPGSMAHGASPEVLSVLAKAGALSPVNASGNARDSDDEDVDAAQGDEGGDDPATPASSGRRSSPRTSSSDEHTPLQQHGSSSFLGSMFGTVGGPGQGQGQAGYSADSVGGPTMVKNNAQPALLADDEMFRPSVDGGNADMAQDAAAAANASASATATAHGSFSSAGSTSHDSAGADNQGQGGAASAFKLRCLRCNGTVEGPKYSTCKCAVPAMCLEDMDGDEKPTSKESGSSGAEGESKVGGLFKAAGGMMSNIGRRASLFASGGNS